MAFALPANAQVDDESYPSYPTEGVVDPNTGDGSGGSVDDPQNPTVNGGPTVVPQRENGDDNVASPPPTSLGFTASPAAQPQLAVTGTESSDLFRMGLIAMGSGLVMVGMQKRRQRKLGVPEYL